MSEGKLLQFPMPRHAHDVVQCIWCGHARPVLDGVELECPYCGLDISNEAWLDNEELLMEVYRRGAAMNERKT